jgi:hypothetical protein
VKHDTDEERLEPFYLYLKNAYQQHSSELLELQKSNVERIKQLLCKKKMLLINVLA